MSSLYASFIYRNRPAQVAWLVTLTLVLLMLASCIATTARTTETTYLLDGKTYVLQEFTHSGTHNFTLLEVVNGERKFTALYDMGEGAAISVFNDPIPEDAGHLTTIMTVAQTGTQQGETVKIHQRSIDPTRIVDGE